ncbi:MAG: dUTP diphosphatase [Clostridiales bacterium]|nr:dUTP diphosphatase [Clostridiales bacterium]HQA85850.1 dUTP diphosphatase [Erysipelotrichaceae bacterium]
MNLIKVYIKQTDNAKDLPLPQYMSEEASGADLYANVLSDVTLNPGEYKLIPTGIMLELPFGYEAQVRARSGLAAKYGIGLVNGIGTIDSDYRGEIKVIMINWGEEPFAIKRGDRIAQLVFQKIEHVQFELSNNLTSTNRSSGGFGHTGV